MSDIKYAYPLILNKVASPHYATPTLRRSRLIEWLNNAANCRATVLAADAGYGKTTLLWQWEREVDFPCYWYKLDRSDRDWTFHISYLIEAIAKRHSGFGTRAHSMLQQLGGPGSSRPGVAAYLLAEMHERLTEPCTFIIDDWHYVNAVTEVRGLWNQILRDAPPTCRFVFSSRAKPKLQFARFKTHNGYAELRTDSLRFTQDEIAELFRDIYKDPLDASELEELDQKTEGWAASLQLVEVSLRQHAESVDRRAFLRSIAARTDTDLFNFLAEEVLDQQPEDTRNFLLTTSILQQITPEVAARLAGVHDGRRALAELEQSGLFTHRLDEDRFRYHNLFRGFLERRLIDERSAAEVGALHIHAASYFETSHEWPEAIHHYLNAGLQRQAARLIAKHGEEVATEGRLGLVDDWLLALPADAVRQNARLSLLHGETSGIRGDWEVGIASLDRAREFFRRKTDDRLEALACLKLSTLYSNFGDTKAALEVAQAGADLVPPDAIATRLRLEGNLAITRTWLTEKLDVAVAECERIAAEASSRGFEHFAAIAKHNAGGLMLRMGRVRNAIDNLEEAARYWSQPPTSPFADNAELVAALLADGDIPAARAAANEGIRRTAPWPRPHADAHYGLALVCIAEGQFDRALTVLDRLRRNPSVLGAVHASVFATSIEAVFLAGGPSAQIAEMLRLMNERPTDPRYSMENAPARAIATHVAGGCRGGCLTVRAELQYALEQGAEYTANLGSVKVGVLSVQHGGRQTLSAWDAVRRADREGILPAARWWLRHYTRCAESLLSAPDGVDLLVKISDIDPEGWRASLLQLVERATGPTRERLIQALMKHANRGTIEAMRALGGRDVTDARRRLQHMQAARLYLQTFGGISLHRGDWNGPSIAIPKRRVRTLLGVLAAYAHRNLTRDMAIEIMWPAADADAAVNNLNQTVFQLRRYIEPDYHGGDSPEYVISTSEEVALNSDLIRTDLGELRRTASRLATTDWTERQAIARRAVELVRGEFLADLRYEDWAAQQQMQIHGDVRAALLPIARSESGAFDPEIALMAGTALLVLDPYDEAATLALARNLSASGRRVAARDLVLRYVKRLRDEFEEEPSADVSDFVAGKSIRT